MNKDIKKILMKIFEVSTNIKGEDSLKFVEDSKIIEIKY